jgi:hypothetical protein
VFIPKLVGALAVLVLVVGAVFVFAGRRRAGIWLAASALGLGVLGVGLAVETEVRYRGCNHWNDANVKYRPEGYGIGPDQADLLMPGSPSPRTCERWPW